MITFGLAALPCGGRTANGHSGLSVVPLSQRPQLRRRMHAVPLAGSFELLPRVVVDARSALRVALRWHFPSLSGGYR